MVKISKEKRREYYLKNKEKPLKHCKEYVERMEKNIKIEVGVSLRFNNENELQQFKEELYLIGKTSFYNLIMSKTRENDFNKKIFSINDLNNIKNGRN